jgi:hypothetical protein
MLVYSIGFHGLGAYSVIVDLWTSGVNQARECEKLKGKVFLSGGPRGMDTVEP